MQWDEKANCECSTQGTCYEENSLIGAQVMPSPVAVRFHPLKHSFHLHRFFLTKWYKMNDSRLPKLLFPSVLSNQNKKITFFNPAPGPKRPLRPAPPKCPMWSLAVSFWRHGRNHQKIDRSCQRSPQGHQPGVRWAWVHRSVVVWAQLQKSGKSSKKCVIPLKGKKKHRNVSLKNVTPKRKLGKLYSLPNPISQVFLCDLFFNFGTETKVKLMNSNTSPGKKSSPGKHLKTTWKSSGRYFYLWVAARSLSHPFEKDLSRFHLPPTTCATTA